jgi:4a-hydroxytetrahydrobiopterin dehydratase
MSDWKETDNKLERDFEFNNFQEALDFINAVGKLAEAANHHPDILLHGYKKVLIKLTTHSEKRITKKDLSLANEIDSII